MQDLLHFLSTYGYAGIFLLLMLGIWGLPFPDEIVLAFAGYLIFKGCLHPLPTFLAAFLGAGCGITVSYAVGRYLGFYLLRKYGPRIHLTRERMARVERWFARAGKWALVWGYFIAGVRHLTALVAGSSRLPAGVFAPFAYCGAFLWTITYLLLGYFLGEELPRLAHELHQWHRLFLLGSGVLLLLILGWLIWRQRKNRSRSS
jgi:membrane protein DedA with SNARE-associated domain